MKKIKLEEIIHKLKRNVIKVNFFFFFLLVLVVFQITYIAVSNCSLKSNLYFTQ